MQPFLIWKESYNMHYQVNNIILPMAAELIHK